MIDILTVCTGNICRSPLAEQLLRARLADLSPRVSSAGTRGLTDAPMTPEAEHLAVQLGVPPADAGAHRSRFLREEHLVAPDLVLTMTRDHRREIAELAPSRVRTAFTIREFARLAEAIPPAELAAAAEAAGSDPSERLRAVVLLIASYRGLVPPPPNPADDDVIDPFRQDWQVYLRSAEQLRPAVDTVVWVVRAAVAQD